jgi:excisionase family DNA binding protein
MEEPMKDTDAIENLAIALADTVRAVVQEALAHQTVVTPQDDGRLGYSVPEAAKALGVGEWAIRTLIRRGDLPVIKVGGRTVIRKTDLGKAMDMNTRTQNRAPAPQNTAM